MGIYMSRVGKIGRTYGWRRALPDHRNHMFAAAPEVMSALPSSVDLRPLCPPVYDQKTLGCCTGCGISAVVEFDRMKQGLPDWAPSRLFIYYCERSLEGTIQSDSGAAISDGIRAINQFGVCRENPTWPYDISQFTVTPPPAAYAEALQHESVSYRNVVQNLSQIKSALASGFPVVFGFTVFSSLESDAVAQTGQVPMPAANEECLGGHCTVICGYLDATQQFIVRNSWSDQWGDKGYFYLPYSYVTDPNLASDFWVVTLVK
jgi:C1A family cysteine protease